MAATKRRYSDDERAAALLAVDANGGDMQAASRQTGIPWQTIQRWVNGNVHPSVLQKQCEKKHDLVAKLEELAWKLANSIPGKVKDASLQQVATSMGICIDKARLLREDAQPDTTPPAMNDDERRARLLELLDAARARGTGQPPPAPEPLPAPHTNGEAAGVP